ncbi:hypothetical protein D9M70_550080 [compost metagenome]
MCGDEEFGAEGFLGFVDGEAGHVACQFVERAAGLAHVERIEVFAVMRVDGAGAIASQVDPHLFHGSPIRRAESNVVDRPGSRRRRPEASRVAHVDNVAGGGGEATDGIAGGRFTVTEMGLQEANGFCRLLGKDCGAAQASDRILFRDIARAPGSRGRNRLGADELDDDAVRILEAQHRFAELLRRP